MASACASSAIAAVAIASPSSQKNGSILGATKASFLSGRKLRVRNYTAPSGTRSLSVCAVAADPDRPLWFPGSTPPPWLDGSLPGDFGFDPLGLGSDPESLRWNVQSELVHCRWAMLGAAGIFIPELLTKIGILNTPSWYTAGELEYFTDTTTLFVIELILIGWAEGRRWADILKPGSVNTDPIFPNNKLTGTDVGYPGGLWFDPLGWGSGSPEKIKELRTKEIKNGRLAMLAVMGAWFQHIYTGTGPIDNLFAHLADPGHATVFAKTWHGLLLRTVAQVENPQDGVGFSCGKPLSSLGHFKLVLSPAKPTTQVAASFDNGISTIIDSGEIRHLYWCRMRSYKFIGIVRQNNLEISEAVVCLTEGRWDYVHEC